MDQLKLVREIPSFLRHESEEELRSLLGELEIVVGETALLGTDANVCKIVVSRDDPEGGEIAALHAVFYRRPGENVSLTTLGAAPSFKIDGKVLRDATIVRRMKQLSFGELTFRILFVKGGKR